MAKLDKHMSCDLLPSTFYIYYDINNMRIVFALITLFGQQCFPFSV